MPLSEQKPGGATGATTAYADRNGPFGAGRIENQTGGRSVGDDPKQCDHSPAKIGLVQRLIGGNVRIRMAGRSGHDIEETVLR